MLDLQQKQWTFGQTKNLLPSNANSSGIGTAIRIPECKLSFSDVAIKLAAWNASVTLYGAFEPLLIE